MHPMALHRPDACALRGILRPFACLLVAAAAGVHPSAAQSPAILRGTVITSAGAALRGVSVVASDPAGRARSAISDTVGAFTLPLAGDGRYIVNTRAIGYRSSATIVQIRGGIAQPLRIVLGDVTVLPPVQVIGSAAGRRALHPGASELAGAVSVLSGSQISREQVAFAQELLRKVPGVYRAEFNQGIVAGDIGVRGFNSESEIASTKLLIDGIPSNANSGVSEMNALFPLEISQIDIVRGTNDPRFGMFNLAGNIGVETPRGGSYMTTRLQAGAFGAREGQLLTAWEQSGFSQTLFAGLRSSDGYRDRTGMSKWSVSGKWFYRSPDERVSIGVIGRSHRLETAAPGYLTFAQSRSTPRLSPVFAADDGGNVDTDHGSLHVDVRQTATLAWSLKAYLQRFDRARFVRFSAAGAQQERLEDERQRGAIATATWRPAAMSPWALVITGGVDRQEQDNLQQRYRDVARVRQATLRDYDFTLDNDGAFLQVTGAPLARLQLAAGLRADRFAGSFLNVTTNATLPIIDYGWIPQPKASATLRLTSRLSTYANYGRAFQIGSGVATYSTKPLAPSRNDGAEIGFVSTPITSVTARAGIWRQVASDEVRLKFDNTGDSENIGRTRRTGVDVESTWRVTRTLSVWGAGTSQRAILVEPGLANATSRGKLLNHVPSWTAKYGADWSPRVGVSVTAWSYMQGDYQITPQNDRGRWGGIQTVNTDISYRWRSAAVGLGVTNLFDRYSEYAWWDGTQTLHSPAAPRSMFVTLTLDR